jgi:hypothetical protein
VSPKLQLRNKGHGSELIVRHASDLEHRVRADGDAVAFSLATFRINDRPKLAWLGIAVLRVSRRFGDVRLATLPVFRER